MRGRKGRIKCLSFSKDFEENSNSEISRACGESQLNSVIKGSIPASKLRSMYKVGDRCDGKNQHKKASAIFCM